METDEFEPKEVEAKVETNDLIEQKKKEIADLKAKAKAEKKELQTKAAEQRALLRDDKKILKQKLDQILKLIYDYRKLKAAEKKDTDILDKIQLLLHDESTTK